MDIAIIGAGNVGRALATAFDRAGHDVVIASRDPKDARAAATGSGIQVVTANAEAAARGRIIVLAVPADALESIAIDIRGAAAGRIVVDVTNRMSFGPEGPAIDDGPSNAERLAAWLPESHVIKALNTVFASKQASPVTDGIQLDGFVAGDDAAAKAAVLDLVRSIGLSPVDVGPLARAQQLEQLAFLNIAINIAGGSWSSGWKLVGAPVDVAA